MISRNKVLQIFKRFYSHNPNPTTELIYYSPFELLVAVILSQQATDKSVNQVTKKLFSIANRPETMLQLGEAALKKYIQSIGLYNTKASYIIKTCKLLVKHHHSTIPADRDALEALPGIGRKSANVLLNTLFNQPKIAVDTHVFRVSRRIGLSSSKTPKQLEEDLLKLLPKKYLRNAHHWLVLHGRYICIAKKPRCTNCFIQNFCNYSNKSVKIASSLLEPVGNSLDDIRKH